MSWQTPKVDWTRADGVRDTDLNRIEGNSQYLYENKAELTDFNALKSTVDNALYDINNRVLLQNIAIGTEFGLYESGVLVPFIKLVDNYESSGRILVVRKDCLYVSQLRSGGDTVYEGCLTDTWVNGTYGGGYPEMLSSAVQSVLTPVNIKSQGNFSLGTISRKAFLLSMQEMQLLGNDGIPLEGTSIAYFNTSTRRISRLNGSTTHYWTRSINNATGNACYVSAGGTYAVGNANEATLGIRPAFTLPGTLEVTTGIPDTSNVLAVAEVL